MDGGSCAKARDAINRSPSVRRMMCTTCYRCHDWKKKIHVFFSVLVLLTETGITHTQSTVTPSNPESTSPIMTTRSSLPPSNTTPSVSATSTLSTVRPLSTINMTTESFLPSNTTSSSSPPPSSSSSTPPSSSLSSASSLSTTVMDFQTTTMSTESSLPSNTSAINTFSTVMTFPTTPPNSSTTMSPNVSSSPAYPGLSTLSLPLPSMSSISPSPSTVDQLTYTTVPTPVTCNFSQNCMDQSVYYWMMIRVEVTGELSNESNITAWLQSLFQNHLGECNSSLSTPSTVPSTFSTLPFEISNGTDTSSMAATLNSSGSAAPTNNISSFTTSQPQSSTTATSMMKEIETTSPFQNIDVMCDNKTAIRQTTCTVLLQLSQPTSTCCIAQTVSIMEINSSIQGQVVGGQVEKVVKGLCNINGGVAGSFDKCNGSADFEIPCNSSATVNVSCNGNSETVYVPVKNQDQTNCSASYEKSSNFCYCSSYCNSTAAYYSLDFKIKDPSFDLTQVKSQISLLSNPICKISDLGCQAWKNISEIYENSTVLCADLSCSVFVKLKQAIDVCSVSAALMSLMQNQTSIQTNGDVIRTAICSWDNNPNLDRLQPYFVKVDISLSPSDFCLVENLDRFLNYCNNGTDLPVFLMDKCIIDPVTPLPTTSLTSPETTSLTNVTTTTTSISTSQSSVDNSTTLQTTTTTLKPAITESTTTLNFTSVITPTSSTAADPATTTNSTASTSAAEKAAEELLNLSKNASSLTSADVEQLVSNLESLLSGPNVSLTLGNTSINIVSNLQDAPANALASTSNRIIGIVDKVGLKLVVQGQSETIFSPSVALAVKRVNGAHFQQTSFTITDPSNLQIDGVSRFRRSVETKVVSPQGSIILPASLTENFTTLQQQLASRVEFNFYQKNILFQDRSLNSNESRLVSGVLSSSVSNLSISNLRENVIISLKNTEAVMANLTVSCVFWDFSLNGGSGGWSARGCSVLNSTETETVCGCNHLTSFGVLLDISRQGVTSRLQSIILTYITYIGCGISAIFLSVTLLTYLSFEKLRKDIPSKILIQLCLALLMLNLVFLLDAWLALYPNAVGLCISTAFFLHYFLLASFTWMALEAVHMYIALVKVFNTYISRFMIKIGFAGWGIPLVVVIIVIAIDKNNYGLVSYGNFEDGSTDDFCWLKNNIAFYVAVVAYFCVVFLLNFAMFIVVMVQLCRIKRQNPHNLQHRSGLQDLQSVAGLTVLLGLTWGFAFFAWGPVNLPFMYLFAIFNTLQGFFIFVFHCAVKENVRRQWRTYLCCGKLRLPENSDWSHTATQKTKKSSVNKVGSSFQSTKSSNSNNSSSSTTFLYNNSSGYGSDHSLGINSPFDDRIIMAQEDSSSDVVLNEINHNHRSQRSH